MEKLLVQAAYKILLANYERSKLPSFVILLGINPRIFPNFSYSVCSSSSSNINRKCQHEYWIYYAHRICKESVEKYFFHSLELSKFWPVESTVSGSLGFPGIGKGFYPRSGFIGVNLAGFLVDKFKRLKLVALCCVALCKIFTYMEGWKF